MSEVMKGIDISRWQGAIDFKKVKESGIDFVIIKAGGSDKGIYKDSHFEKNYKAAKAAKLHIGAYYFVGKNCINSAAGKADAEQFESMIKGKQFDMPIYIDIETTAPSNKKGATDAVVAFCEHMEKRGYYVGIYASDIYGFKERLDCTRLEAYDKWVARYGSEPVYIKEYGLLQYSSTGHIPGITGHVDLDNALKDYPKIIKANKLNGYK